MSRKHRNESPGYHHVVTRGNNRRNIYDDDRDRTLFCLNVDRVARRCGWKMLAYVLMRNHYHLLLRVGEEGLSGGMHDLNMTYAVQFNARHSRINHLFGKRYWNHYLVTDVAVQNAARYIVQNPWRAGGTKPLSTYAWSSYAATLGIEFPRISLAQDDLLAFFGNRPSTAVAAFEKFCHELPRSIELDDPRPVESRRVPGAAK
jgi:REP element-mobilizing transposase RayT